MAKHMVLTYLHFRILKISHWHMIMFKTKSQRISYESLWSIHQSQWVFEWLFQSQWSDPQWLQWLRTMAMACSKDMDLLLPNNPVVRPVHPKPPAGPAPASNGGTPRWEEERLEVFLDGGMTGNGRIIMGEWRIYLCVPFLGIYVY